ncbi:MAG: hypothetical protein EOP39_25820 [Rubrivivax sp.]|nr:MAG: hypothetical protein EOP39_25820 [Rubrivivax sp.]
MAASNNVKYWFPARRHGWGWGLPYCWQGWAVYITYVTLLVAGVVLLDPSQNEARFLAYIAAISVALLAICWAKGERPAWRWGNRDA